MRLDQLLNDIDRDALIELFGGAALAAVEAALTEKNGKSYVHCLVRDKPVQAKREELVRQLWLQRLALYYMYPASRLAVEYPLTFGRDTSKRADIVVMDADRPTVPYLIVEVKQGKLKDGKEQLRSYTHATRSSSPPSNWPARTTAARRSLPPRSHAIACSIGQRAKSQRLKGCQKTS